MKKWVLPLLIFGAIGLYSILTLHPNKAGTGLMWSDGRHILTHYHVVKNARALQVRFYNENPTPAALVAWDEGNDLALLAIHETRGGTRSEIALGDSTLLKAGDPVFTLGYPLINTIGDHPRYAEGTVRSRRGIGGHPNMFQVDVVLQTGNSGVPMFNDRGELVGLAMIASEAVSAGLPGDVPGQVNFAVKAEHLAELLKPLGARVATNEQPPLSAEARQAFVRRIEKNIVLVEAEK